MNVTVLPNEKSEKCRNCWLAFLFGCSLCCWTSKESKILAAPTCSHSNTENRENCAVGQKLVCISITVFKCSIPTFVWQHQTSNGVSPGFLQRHHGSSQWHFQYWVHVRYHDGNSLTLPGFREGLEHPRRYDKIIANFVTNRRNARATFATSRYGFSLGTPRRHFECRDVHSTRGVF